MVKQITGNKKTYHICEECNFSYKDEKIAIKCENWCRKYHSCTMEITKHAANIQHKA